MTGRVLVSAPFLKPGHSALEPLVRAGIEIVYGSARRMERPEWTQLVASADGVVAGSDPFTADIIGAAPRLRVIARGGVGFDAIDVAAATAAGVAICIHAGLNRDAVAEMALTLMLITLRRLPENLRDYDGGGWTRFDGRQLSGTTVGIVGLGRIGRRLVELLAPFRATILALDANQDTGFAAAHGVAYVDEDELLLRSDVVTLHMPLAPATRSWLNGERLARMKPGAHVVNTARGEVLDQDALLAALESGRLGGAALDVAVGEPLATDDPLRRPANLLLSPHVGGATLEARALGGTTAVANVLAILSGRDTPDVVNPDYRRHAHQITPSTESAS